MGRIKVESKTGQERFCATGRELDFDLMDFWRWSTSDLVDNTMRGVLAEYIVARALGLADGLRVGWDAYDLRTESGIKIEVKSSAYLQSWGQMDFCKIGFDVSPKTPFDGDSGKSGKERKRWADVYVFALLKHREKESINPLDVEQWTFFVLPTSVLDEKIPLRPRITEKGLLQLDPVETNYWRLKDVIESIFPGAHSHAE
ncbi:MAG: hypothetical protein LC785_13820 [Acidobacteria bacterium]|nr:hypothetical protein [Acidobacteriota bacterium]